MSPRLPPDPAEVSIRSERSAFAEAIPPGDVTAPCRGPVYVYAHYDDLWCTPVTMAPLRITDQDGVVVDGDVRTQGLPSFGKQDGDDAVPALRPELGHAAFSDAKRGAVTAELIADSSAGAEADALVDQIMAIVTSFTREMETAILPWLTDWNTKGLLSIPEAYRNGQTRGLTAWWDGEKDFWVMIGDWVSGAFESAVNATMQAAQDLKAWYDDLPWWGKASPVGYWLAGQIGGLFDSAADLWQRRDQIMALVKAFVSGVVDDIETALQALVDLPGEIGEIITLLVDKSAEWTGALIEMIRETDVIETLFTAFAGITMMMPPNLWAEALGTIEGYLLPEILLAIVFTVIAALTEGAGAPLLVTRLTMFVAKVRVALVGAGKIGPLLLKIFTKLDELYELIIKLAKALKRKIQEAVEGATDVVNRIVRRSGKRARNPADLPCFNQPPNATRQQFLQQLQEQENAINNSDLSELMRRRELVEQRGTSALRDSAAQRATRDQWIRDKTNEIRQSQNLSRSAAREFALQEAAELDATHVLDIVAGGDPSAISGLQNRSVNRSLGSQWRDRVKALDDALSDQAKQGAAKANVRLKPC